MSFGRRIRATTAALLASVLAGALLLVVVEGLASWATSVEVALERPAGPVLTRFDPDLGWVSIPSLAKEDVWGPGTDVHTTARGFRAPRTGPEAPEPRAPSSASGRPVRVLCSGDSFTYGQGVDDDETWCHRLSVLGAGREALNLGVLGYGVDQAYLRYRRDAADLPHEVHVFAFIGGDFDRAEFAVRDGYAKPVLRLEGERLAVAGVPVPERLPALRRRLSKLGESLRSVEAVTRVLRKAGWMDRPRPPTEQDRRDRVQRMAPLLRRLFDEVEALGRSRGARTLFVYLPVAWERQRDDPWRPFVRESLAEAGYPFLDLTESLRSLDEQASRALFIPECDAAGGHYSTRGNAWAARAIHAALRELEGL